MKGGISMKLTITFEIDQWILEKLTRTAYLVATQLF